MNTVQVQTKWTILLERAAKARREADELEAQLSGYERTPISVKGCRTCGEPFATEADFAKHYYVPDPRLLNIGTCPSRLAISTRCI